MTTQPPIVTGFDTWVRIKCQCGKVVAGYPYGQRPKFLSVHHQCDPASDTYQIMELRG